MEALQQSTNELLNLLLQQKSRRMLENEPVYIIDQFFRQIHESIRVLPILTTEEICIPVPKLLQTDYRNNKYLEPILELQKYVHEYLYQYTHSVILHGSMASLDYVKGWSDVDIIYVLKNKTLKYLRNVREHFLQLEDFLYRIDPQQHHGIQYITERDLQYYPDTFYPHNLYREAKSLFGPACRLTFNVRDTSGSCHNLFESIYQRIKLAYKNDVLEHHGLNGVYLQENYTNPDCMYQLKYYLSLLMLLPVVWLNIAGIFCSKKDSFTYAKVFISEENWEIIEKASLVRSRWNSIPEDNMIPQWVMDTLGYDYFMKGFYFVHELKTRANNPSFVKIKDYYNAMRQFCYDNPGKTIALCGSIQNPGYSDLDFLVLDEEPSVSDEVREFFKPLDKYGGEVLVCPKNVYPNIPYIIDMRITPLQGEFPVLNVPTEKERGLLNKIEILEWLPERLLRIRKILDERVYTKDKLHLILKSIYRSINMVAKYIGQPITVYNEQPSYEQLEISYEVAQSYYQQFEKHLPISGEVSGTVEICPYYTITDYEFLMLKKYLYYLTLDRSSIAKKLKERCSLKSVNFVIEKDFADLVRKRWEICDRLYVWFLEKGYDKGMMKWGWLLSK